ncbi:MAG: nucleoside kinase [Gammaproteobacteria bacterium]|nr:nucleoside kinase [Gammaproteobacteria bacterium]
MDDKIKLDQLSQTVFVHLPEERVISAPRGTIVGKILGIIADDYPSKIVGAIVNGSLRELTYPINFEANVTPVTMSTPDGMRIYRRSLIMLLEAAFFYLHPDKDIVIDHSVSFGGYYCRIEDKDQLSKKDLQVLYEKMRELVDQDLPITRQEVPLHEAIEHFQTHEHYDKVQLLKHRKKDYLMMYYLGEHRDYHHGYMVPSTGYLEWFALEPADGGFTLRFPRRHRPNEILPLHNYPKLLATFRQYGNWLELLEIDSVGALNDAILAGRIREVVLVSEALHDLQIASIAEEVATSKGEARVILIAGPSSSGKTTSSRRLSIQLLAHGLQPFPLELDNYFVNREETPLDEDGNYDFENINALNREKLNDDIRRLIRGERVQLPKFNFVTGNSVPGDEIQLSSDQIIILEGIHGLNPALLEEIPSENTYRIYISALTQLNLDRHNRVSTTDTRLIRRIVRDARTRGYTPQETIQRWESVRLGEKRYIFPYQENADVMFNSALVYELAALKPAAEPLLRQVPFGTLEHIEIKRLLALLEWFLPVDTEFIPDNSLLREFLGGSILRDFKVWKNRSNR